MRLTRLERRTEEEIRLVAETVRGHEDRSWYHGLNPAQAHVNILTPTGLAAVHR